jgi:hypothetical protein
MKKKIKKAIEKLDIVRGSNSALIFLLESINKN